MISTCVALTLSLLPVITTAQQQPRSQQQPSPTDDALRAAQPLTRLFAVDPYTEYELLDNPNQHAFRIVFMPTETRRGATILINGTRHGSDGGDVAVYDPRTGKPLKFEYLSGEEARAQKVPGNFVPEDHYIIAQLPQPVPEGGEGRVLIIKTYKDARTYYPQGADGKDLVWVRDLSAMRFGVVLPKGYAFVSSNIAAQVMTTPDGRLKLSLTNPSGGGSPITIRARKTTANFAGNATYDKVFDDGKTLYDLDEPETHRFRLEQTYSDRRKGEKAKLDVMGYASLQDLRVVDLDTAKTLPTMREGKQTFAKLEVPIVNDKQSARLKVSGRVQDPAYKIDNGELVFNRTIYGLRNTVLLPVGWEVAAVSQPCTLGENQGRAFVALVNTHQEDAMTVTVRARKRADAAKQ